MGMNDDAILNAITAEEWSIGYESVPARVKPKESFDDLRKNREVFKRDLTHLINKHCLENNSNTPDFILAEYLCMCLDNFTAASNARTKWFKK